MFAAVALSLLVPALVLGQDRPLRIGYVTTQFGTEAAAFEPLTRYLSSFLDGRRFEILPLDSVDDMVDAAERDQLDFAVASSVGLVMLMAQHRVRPIATITRGRRVVALSRRTLAGWLAALRE